MSLRETFDLNSHRLQQEEAERMNLGWCFVGWSRKPHLAFCCLHVCSRFVRGGGLRFQHPFKSPPRTRSHLLYCRSWRCQAQCCLVCLDCFSCLFFLKWVAGSLSCFEGPMNRRGRGGVCVLGWDVRTKGLRVEGGILQGAPRWHATFGHKTLFFVVVVGATFTKTSSSVSKLSSSSSSFSLIQETGHSKLPASVRLASEWKWWCGEHCGCVCVCARALVCYNIPTSTK